MPVTAVCDGCSKRYAVPDAGVGRRAKCKACGHVFVVTARPRPAAAAVPVAAPPVGDGWTGGMRRAAGPAGRVFRKINADDRAVLAAVVVAGVLAGMTFVTPRAGWVALFTLPTLAAVFLLVGGAVEVARSAREPGAWRLPWAGLGLILVTGIFAALGLRVVFLRWFGVDAFRNTGIGVQRLMSVAVKAFGIACLGPLVLALMAFRGGLEMTPAEIAAVREAEVAPIQWREQTTANLGRIAGAVLRFEARDGSRTPPPSLAAVAVLGPPVGSPWDRSAGLDGYGYLPQNLPTDGRRPFLYDAAELRQTGHTHAVYSVYSPVRVVSRRELAADAAAAIP